MTKIETIPGTKAIAQRIVNAHTNFAITLIEIAGITQAQAEMVTAKYLKAKVAKLDAVNGRISVKHGAFLDAATINHVVKDLI